MFLWSKNVQNTGTAVVNRLFCVAGNGEADQIALAGGKKGMPSGPSARSCRAAAP